MKTPKAYNYTPRRAKALPIVEHSKFGRCILISKERDKKNRKTGKKIPGSGRWSLFGGGNEEYRRGGKRYQEESSAALERELKEELGTKFSIDRKLDLKKTKNAIGEIISDKTGKLNPKKESDKVKQRIFAVKLSGEVQLHGTDKGELTGIGYYPIGNDANSERIRKILEENMDEYAIQAMRNNIAFLNSPSIQPGNVKIKNRGTKNDLRGFQNALNELNTNRALILKILDIGRV